MIHVPGVDSPIQSINAMKDMMSLNRSLPSEDTPKVSSHLLVNLKNFRANRTQCYEAPKTRLSQKLGLNNLAKPRKMSPDIREAMLSF